jgi:hypothetical protein
VPCGLLSQLSREHSPAGVACRPSNAVRHHYEACTRETDPTGMHGPFEVTTKNMDSAEARKWLEELLYLYDEVTKRDAVEWVRRAHRNLAQIIPSPYALLVSSFVERQNLTTRRSLPRVNGCSAPPTKLKTHGGCRRGSHRCREVVL